MGYNMLVNDMTRFPSMRSTVILSVICNSPIQLPTSWEYLRGQRIYSLSSKICCRQWNQFTFMETHDNPSKALSDANTVLDIKYLENVLYQAKKVHEMRLELFNELGPDNVHPTNK